LIRRIALSLVLLVALLAVAGFLYENICEARDRRFNPMPGKLFDVGGRKMHIDCAGSGSPTVILDSGLGDTYYSWHKLQPEIAKVSSVCSYDRAGLGFSDRSSDPRTSQVIAQELHALLQAASIPPPYILVGHSMAGYTVRVYTSLYRNEVAGIVLVDASHPDQESRFPAALKDMEGSWQREATFLELTMPFGIPRLFGFCDEDIRQRAANCNWHSAHEASEEMKFFATSGSQAAGAGSLGDLPLTVLSHDPDKPSSELPPDLTKPTNDAWEKMQEELSHLSTRGTQSIAKGSAHYIQGDRPDLVVDAVRNVVNQARQDQASTQPKP
jgi:pimeloyl-ACP methyl ester carboxylesterase